MAKKVAMRTVTVNQNIKVACFRNQNNVLKGAKKQCTTEGNCRVSIWSPTKRDTFHIACGHLTHWYQSQSRHVVLLELWNELGCKSLWRSLNMPLWREIYDLHFSIWNTWFLTRFTSRKSTGGIFQNTAIQCLWLCVGISKCWHVETDPRAWRNSSLCV